MKRLSELNIIKEAKNWENDEEFVNELTKKLENALAEEFIAHYQYTIVWPFINGNESTELVEILKDNAKDELEDHAYWLMDRLNQLNKTPENIFDINNLDNFAVHKYIKPVVLDCKSIIMDNIKAEKGAIETYLDLEEFTKDKDIVTHSKVEEILADEREHLHLLEELLKDLK